jgi:hypothetical protein
MWVDSTKNVIQYDLQLVYISALLQCVFYTYTNSEQGIPLCILLEKVQNLWYIDWK